MKTDNQIKVESVNPKQMEAAGKDYLWNTFGTFFYFFCQYLLTSLDVRQGNVLDAGIFSIVLSITNIFYCVSIYGVRNYQVADIENRFSDSDYIHFRHLCTLIALGLFVISLPFFGYSVYTSVCCLIYLFYKFGESYMDVLFGIFQKRDEVKKIAISYMIKGIVSVTTFTLGMILFHSLMATLLINKLGIFVVLIFYDIQHEKGLTGPKLTRNQALVLLRDCFPLMLYSLLVPALNLIMRTDIEKMFGTEQLGYFSSVTMVLSILNVLMTSVFVMLIPTISILYAEAKTKKLIRLILIAVAGFGLLCLAGVGAGALLGDFVFSLLFGKEILPYMNLLAPTIIASIILSCVTFFSSVLTSFSKNDEVVIGNFPSVLIVFMFTPWILQKSGMIGSVFLLCLGLFVSALILFGFIFLAIHRRNRKKEMKRGRHE